MEIVLNNGSGQSFSRCLERAESLDSINISVREELDIFMEEIYVTWPEMVEFNLALDTLLIALIVLIVSIFLKNEK